MDVVPWRPSATLLRTITNLIVPAEVEPESALELNLAISDRDLAVRGFADYLALADKVYGRFSVVGIKSYSQAVSGRLRISEVRQGSIEAIIEQAITSSRDVTPLVVLWLFLKYLPQISEATKNLAEAYKTLEEGRTIRDKRKRLRDKIREDTTLQKLDARRQNQVVGLLTAVGRREHRHIASAARFSERSVQSVSLVVRRRRKPE